MEWAGTSWAASPGTSRAVSCARAWRHNVSQTSGVGSRCQGLSGLSGVPAPLPVWGLARAVAESCSLPHFGVSDAGVSGRGSKLPSP